MAPPRPMDELFSAVDEMQQKTSEMPSMDAEVSGS